MGLRGEAARATLRAGQGHDASTVAKAVVGVDRSDRDGRRTGRVVGEEAQADTPRMAAAARAMAAADSMAAALWAHSAFSEAGSLSATIPAPGLEHEARLIPG